MPLAENTSCIINAREAEYEFVANGLKFSLEISKITDVSIRTDVALASSFFTINSISGLVNQQAPKCPSSVLQFRTKFKGCELPIIQEADLR